MKAKMDMTVTAAERLADDVYSTVFRLPEGTFPPVAPGQFVGVYPHDRSALLPRPISICRADPGERTLRLVYRAVGKGTRELAAAQPGESFSVLGILGNGYDLNALRGKNILLLGGGIGIPPLLELAAALKAQGPERRVTAALGYRTAQLFLMEEFEQTADAVLIATEDGSAGVRGNVLDAVRAAAPVFDAVCACGPLPMLRGVKRFAQEAGALCYLSLEERMACGVGVCLGCVAKTAHRDEHLQVNNARICTEGPVFEASEVEI